MSARMAADEVKAALMALVHMTDPERKAVAVACASEASIGALPLVSALQTAAEAVNGRDNRIVVMAGGFDADIEHEEAKFEALFGRADGATVWAYVRHPDGRLLKVHLRIMGLKPGEAPHVLLGCEDMAKEETGESYVELYKGSVDPAGVGR